MSAGKVATMAALVFIGVFFVALGLQGENSWATLITGAGFVAAALVIYAPQLISVETHDRFRSHGVETLQIRPD